MESREYSVLDYHYFKEAASQALIQFHFHGYFFITVMRVYSKYFLQAAMYYPLVNSTTTSLRPIGCFF